jgi:hypothetical protein
MMRLAPALTDEYDVMVAAAAKARAKIASARRTACVRRLPKLELARVNEKGQSRSTSYTKRASSIA